MPRRNIMLIDFPDNIPVEKVANAFGRRAGVVFAQPNYLCGLPEINCQDEYTPDLNNPVYIAGISPGPYYNQQATNSSGADSANLFSTGSGIVVAVIDNGIDFGHPLFADIPDSTGYDFVDNDGEPAEETGDMLGHGTFVSGLIKLVAPDCILIPYRAFDESGIGDSYAIAMAIYRAIDDSVDIINMSFNTYTSSSVIETAVAAARQAGITMVASSGNDSCSTTSYPAAYAGVIMVGAIDSLDYLAAYSNYGAYLDVVAPGVMVYSALHTDYESDWGYWSGTSFAAPQVSGGCALILELEPSLTGDSMEVFIRETAETGLLWGTVVPCDTLYGYGRDNVLRSVTCLRRGDVDNSGQIDSLDYQYLINYLNYGGPAPTPIIGLGDVDCSGAVNSLDVSYLINYVNFSGPKPCCQ
ncbi:MAG: S8 family serine peptidase [Candidatus Zixiibacteriota bacterium]